MGQKGHLAFGLCEWVSGTLTTDSREHYFSGQVRAGTFLPQSHAFHGGLLLVLTIAYYFKGKAQLVELFTNNVRKSLRTLLLTAKLAYIFDEYGDP